MQILGSLYNPPPLTMEDFAKNNSLIATKIMGIDPSRIHIIKDHIFVGYSLLIRLNYHENYNLLMGAVEAIELDGTVLFTIEGNSAAVSARYPAFEGDDHVGLYFVVEPIEAETKKLAIWKACLAYIAAVEAKPLYKPTCKPLNK